MTCTQCGHEQVEGKFCAKCGTPLTAAQETVAPVTPQLEKVEVEAAAPTQAAQPTQQTQPTQPAEPTVQATPNQTCKRILKKVY